MAKSLLFISDISGFTEYIQETEIEHSRNVISELLEAMISANTLNLKLAEIEGDALFFYLENKIPSNDELMQQIKIMNTAFYNHLEVLKSKTKWSYKTHANLDKLKLKIVAHSAELSFIKIHNIVKPFGKEVIEIHRLLKNSIKSKNYLLITKQLANDMQITTDYKNNLGHLEYGKDIYDGKEMIYLYSPINVQRLNISYPTINESNNALKTNFKIHILELLKNFFIPTTLYSYH